MNEAIQKTKKVTSKSYKEDYDGPLLTVKNLSVDYPIIGGIFMRQIGTVKAVRDISFSVFADETLGIVGESGCGKTTIAKTILNLVESSGGEIYYKNVRIDNRLKRMRKVRQKFIIRMCELIIG